MYTCNLIASCNCDCGNYIESVDHFFLKCNIYTEHRIQLFHGMSNLGFDIGIVNTLFGNASFENDKNSKLCLLVQKYIVNQWRIQRGAEGTFTPPPPPLKKRERERERERERGGWGGGRFSVPLLSISAFIHSPVKCNKSFYIFTRCIALLVYLISFELLKQSTINQKTK